MDTLLKVDIHKKCVCSIHILTSNTSIMSYYDLFELGSNVLEQYVSSEASLLKNKYDWQVYVLPKTVVSDSIYKKKLSNSLPNYSPIDIKRTRNMSSLIMVSGSDYVTKMFFLVIMTLILLMDIQNGDTRQIIFCLLTVI